ncbi:MAG TPA: hypothetical protein VHC70_03090 [Phycisphaerales bacterium]|nr:hypothetical protein [Phycisphaerales bacterium]
MYGLEPTKPGAPVAETTVGSGVLCARCGYELRGLSAASRCPECGGPIRNSLHAEMLEYAPPEYVKKLWRGALLAQISAIGAAAATSAMIALLVLLIWAAITDRDPAPIFIAMGVVSVAGPLVCGATGLVGWWLLTARDAGVGGVRKDRWLRRVIRASVAVAAACWLCVWAPPVAGGLMDLPPGVYIPLTTVIGLGMLGSTLTMVFATGPYVGQLGKRVGDDHLESMGTMPMKLAGGTGLAMFVGLGAPLLGLIVPALLIALMVYHAMVMRRVKWLVYGVMM